MAKIHKKNILNKNALEKKIKNKRIRKKFKKTNKIISNKKNHILAVKSILQNLLYFQKPETNDDDNEDEIYTEYINKIFNSSIINMLVVYFNNFDKNKDKFKKYKFNIESNFMNKFAYLIKELYLNEIEIAYLTLLLDKLGWDFKCYELWDYFLFLAIYTKRVVTSDDFESKILLKISKNREEDLSYKYYRFINEKNFDDFEKNGITNKELNERLKKLKRPINSYCLKNYVNLSGIVDKIVRLSQPYKMQEKEIKFLIKKNSKDKDCFNNT